MQHIWNLLFHGTHLEKPRLSLSKGDWIFLNQLVGSQQAMTEEVSPSPWNRKQAL